MDNFRGGNDHFRGEKGVIQVLHDPLGHDFRGAVQGNHRPEGTVLIVFVAIEAGHIDPRNFGNCQKKLLFAPTLGLGLVVEGHDFHGAVLPFSQGEKVHKICQRLRVKGTHAPGKDDVFKFLPLCRVKGNPGQAQHIQNVGIRHFIADGEGDHVEILYRLLAFQRPQGKAVFPHGLFHVPPGGKDSLTPDPLHPVHDSVENPHANVGHADLVGIREAEGHPYPDIRQILLDFAPLAAGIAGGLLHRSQNALLQIRHKTTSL